MEIRETTERGIAILCLTGRLDVTTAAEVECAVRHRVETNGPLILLDLSNLEYISSGGLGVMVVLQNELEGKGGQLALCSLTPFVSDVFRTTNLDRRFHIHRDAAQAVVSLTDIDRPH